LLLAVCIPEKFVKAQLASKATGRPLHEIESEMLGITHAEAGAYLLSLGACPIRLSKQSRIITILPQRWKKPLMFRRRLPLPMLWLRNLQETYRRRSPTTCNFLR